LCCALKLRKEGIIARHKIKILSIFGTRPEAIKMAPLVKALAEEPGIDSRICVTGQHQSMLKQVLDLFDLKADYTLDVMTQHQTLNSLTAALYAAIDPVLEMTRPGPGAGAWRYHLGHGRRDGSFSSTHSGRPRGGRAANRGYLQPVAGRNEPSLHRPGCGHAVRADP
jgi:hypothetical protein